MSTFDRRILGRIICFANSTMIGSILKTPSIKQAWIALTGAALFVILGAIKSFRGRPQSPPIWVYFLVAAVFAVISAFFLLRARRRP